MRTLVDTLAAIAVAVGGRVVRRIDGKSAGIVLVIGAALLIALLAAVTQKPSPSHPSSVSISSTYWRLVEWPARGRPLARPIRLHFGRSDSLSGRGVCNDFAGSYARIGWIFAIKAEAHAAQTCDPSVMEIDRNFVTELRRVTRFAIDTDGMLNALDATGTVVFRFRRAARAYDD
jgi:heat shock protein HslJ